MKLSEMLENFKIIERGENLGQAKEGSNWA